VRSTRAIVGTSPDVAFDLLAGAADIALSPSHDPAGRAASASCSGVTVGAVPGISGDMAMAVLLPFVFTMETAPAIGMLMGVYKGSLFGGSISAIMFGVPGTPGAAATILDGFPAKQAGMPNRRCTYGAVLVGHRATSAASWS
jgi:putative tricarboxylic transport membrane protein